MRPALSKSNIYMSGRRISRRLRRVDLLELRFVLIGRSHLDIYRRLNEPHNKRHHKCQSCSQQTVSDEHFIVKFDSGDIEQLRINQIRAGIDQ